LGSLSTPLLLGVFVAGAIATWVAGTSLSKATDVIDRRFNLGEALGGMILLSIAGTLPEIAITVSAAAKGNLGLAAGNLIGGIAMQTMVLVFCDMAASRRQSLSYLVGSLVPVLEALLVVLVVSIVMMGALLPESTSIGPVSPASLAIVVAWLAGLFALNRVRKSPAWKVEMPGSAPGRPHRRQVASRREADTDHEVDLAALIAFGIGCLITLVAGVILEVAGNDLANRANINGVIFGATVLSVASRSPRSARASLPCGSATTSSRSQTSSAQLVPALPLPRRRPDRRQGCLPQSGPLNAWLAALGIALTVIYAFGVICDTKTACCVSGATRSSPSSSSPSASQALFVVPH